MPTNATVFNAPTLSFPNRHWKRDEGEGGPRHWLGPNPMCPPKTQLNWGKSEAKSTVKGDIVSTTHQSKTGD